MANGMNSTVLAKALLLGGLAFWLSIAAFNNATDQATNRALLGAMLDMRLIQEDATGLGKGLLWKAVDSSLAVWLLWAIIAYQAVVAMYLWKASVKYLRAWLGWQDSSLMEGARVTGVRALTAFMSLWLFFLCGGLWFGYWLKQGPVQVVHLLLLIISLTALGFISNRA